MDRISSFYAVGILSSVCMAAVSHGWQGSYLEFGDSATRGTQYVEFEVNTLTTGEHAVMLLYQSPSSMVLHAARKGEPSMPWSLPPADTWTVETFDITLEEGDCTLVLKAGQGDYTGLKLSALGIDGNNWLQVEKSSVFSGPKLTIVEAESDLYPDARKQSQQIHEDEYMPDEAQVAAADDGKDTDSKRGSREESREVVTYGPPAASEGQFSNFTFTVQQEEGKLTKTSPSISFIAIVAMAVFAGLLLMAVLVNTVIFCGGMANQPSAFLTHVNPIMFFRRTTGDSAGSNMQGSDDHSRLRNVAIHYSDDNVLCECAKNDVQE